MADEPEEPEDAPAEEPADAEPEAGASPSAAPPPPPDDGGGRLSVKVLVIALVIQLVLFGGLIALAIHGFPFIGGGADRPDDDPTPATFPAGRVPKTHASRFDAKAAMAIAKMQVDAGQRPAGSATLRKVAEKLRPMLPDGHFEDVPAQPGLRNIVGDLPGPGPVIVIGAHYDSENHPPGFVGANDAAAAVGTVIEVAHAVKKLQRSAVAPGIRFVLFDGEEEPHATDDFYRDALRGSKAYVQLHAEEVRAMILLDYIGNTGVRLPREGSSTRSLWDQVRAAGQKVGVRAIFPDTSEASIFDDHTPFLRAGIPAVDLIDWSYKDKDTVRDTYDKLSEDSVDAVGETIVQLIADWPTQG
ncbi:MAG TPA: M28 family metallopeptidase [Baekduia sp.]|uniref:M28 family metallopeptidase n=1 Tax=Baekduia sp. TaxID=2600305 RepID=UPI002D77229D|nr:M28 family metallopeptidase [Baekduia sp.]HET6507647.1 M28 family metallopeptidase [Baekduia sp.]